jgi:hypothetical protein
MSLILDGTNGLSDVDGSAATPAIRGTDANTGIFFPAADTIAFSEGGAESMRIDSSGYVGIAGTPSNLAMLDVRSNDSTIPQLFLQQDNTAHGWIFYSDRSDGGLKFYRRDGSGSTERIRITTNGVISQNGNWGTNASTALRNNSAAANKFWQSGPDSNNAYIVYNQAGNGVYVVDGGTSWAGLSDERLKDIIEPIKNGLTKVASLRAVIGKFKTDEEGTRRSFLIAQDVQSVLPEAISSTKVQGDETEYLGVSYTDVIPLLVASIKELKTIVDAQAAEIAELKAKA